MTPTPQTWAGATPSDALRVKRIARQERAICKCDLVGARVENIEGVDLQSPAIRPSIAQSCVQRAGGWGVEIAVLGERPGPEVAILQRAEPTGRLAELQSAHRRHRYGVRQIVAGRIAEECPIGQCVRRHQIEPRQGLRNVDAAVARLHKRHVAVKSDPGIRGVFVGEFEAISATGATEDRRAAIADKLVLRFEIEPEQADAGIEPFDEFGAGADLGAA